MPPTTELRHDALSGRSVIVAAGRAARPHTVASIAPEQDAGTDHCPFCEGHEAMTPPELFRTGAGAPGEPGWRVRVVPNLYPIVSPDSPAPGTLGAHEVVVLSPDHHASFGRLDDDAAREVFHVLRDRIALHLGEGCAYGVALLNWGRAAGASIAHPHAQVITLDFVPPEVEAAGHRARDASLDLLTSDLDAARTRGTVLFDHRAAAWLPLAGTSPYL